MPLSRSRTAVSIVLEMSVRAHSWAAARDASAEEERGVDGTAGTADAAAAAASRFRPADDWVRLLVLDDGVVGAVKVEAVETAPSKTADDEDASGKKRLVRSMISIARRTSPSSRWASSTVRAGESGRKLGALGWVRMKSGVLWVAVLEEIVAADGDGVAREAALRALEEEEEEEVVEDAETEGVDEGESLLETCEMKAERTRERGRARGILKGTGADFEIERVCVRPLCSIGREPRKEEDSHQRNLEHSPKRLGWSPPPVERCL